jgi:hypothetical protein
MQNKKCVIIVNHFTNIFPGHYACGGIPFMKNEYHNIHKHYMHSLLVYNHSAVFLQQAGGFYSA